ncbi:site-2 protease family protein [Halobacillus salinarum]|uniref:Site-2 protease family protein n=1 Tax=Halobacillus salinarum TaxID=2932257 RepID=A0ABY4EF22_9BACI|nr:site-2 protease family protein [Halobacillus salinarum]UOQ42658.1 site-2 protease family protein [Halobacillus salinarum]
MMILIRELLVFIFFAAPLGLFIHECGHVIPALCFRSDFSLISVGSGREIMKVRIGKLHFQCRLILFHGAYSLNERNEKFSLRERAIISICGPVMNAAGAAVLWMSSLVHISFSVYLFGLFNLYLALVNLVPFRIKGKSSDGYRFIQLICKSNEDTG